jgi:hypothetical protein
MGCSGSWNGSWSCSTEFEQFQWKLEQFQQ